MANIARPPCAEGVVRTSLASAPCSPALAPWVLAATIMGSAMATASAGLGRRSRRASGRRRERSRPSGHRR
jgi:hypothetical protein